jgi:hypothetical protein
MRTCHLMLVTPLLSAGLVLGTTDAPQGAINAGPTNTVATFLPSEGAFASKSNDEGANVARGMDATVASSDDGDYASGYQKGLGEGRANGAAACPKYPRGWRPTKWGERTPGDSPYNLGYWDGFEQGWDSVCP